jgi:hypothetical protein
MPKSITFRPTILTLSSIPPRLPHISPLLRSLLAQDLPFAAIHLYIPRSYRRFPEWDGHIPSMPDGVTVRRCDLDDGPATKILPALREFAGQDADLLFCDDDTEFAPDWHRSFKMASDARPNACIAGEGFDLTSMTNAARPQDRLPRAMKWEDKAAQIEFLSAQPVLPIEPPRFQSSGFVDILMGHGGVLVRPDMFPQAVFQLPEKTWAVDDIWLSGHLESNGVPIWIDHHIPSPRLLRSVHLIRPLFAEHTEGMERGIANSASVAYFRKTFGIWPLPLGIVPIEREMGYGTPKKAVKPKGRTPSRKKPRNRGFLKRVRRSLRRLFGRQ